MNMMSEIVTERERRHSRAWRIMREELPLTGRYRRYLLLFAPVLALIWLSTIAYLVFVPPSYSSEFTLILPSSSVGSTLNVESIGQAQSSSSSAFSSPGLNPTEKYKQLLVADVTLRRAAKIAQEDREAFKDPAIKLIDQTSLIKVTIRGGTPVQANRRARALRTAFLNQLDILRSDESAQREESDARNLQVLSGKVRIAQRKLIAFQAKHGLATLKQFNDRIAAVESLRDKERNLRLEMSQLSGTARRLANNLNSSPQSANISMRLQGDPVFQQLAQRYANSSVEVSEKGATLGPRHGAMTQAYSEQAELRAALVRRGQELTGLSEKTILSNVDIQLATGRSNLLQSMATSDAQAAGAKAALAAIRSDLARAKEQSPKLIARASQLADLQRDQRVAEAVFSSALARLDTNKLDPFSSYPLVQTLAAPSLPTEPSSPSLFLALIGALAATVLAIIAFGLLWLRQPILDKLSQKD